MRNLIRPLVTCLLFAGSLSTSMAEQKLHDQIKSLIDQIGKRANLKFNPTTPQAATDSADYELQRLCHFAARTQQGQPAELRHR